jgi:signal peptidase I
MERKKKIEKTYSKKRQWIKLIVVMVLYLLFLYWVKSWLGLIVVPFIFDAYITKKIHWTWWKDSINPVTRTVMSWVDAIVFALIAVYFVNLYWFQNYEIPSSSLEKSLRVGDYLYVSKLSYGPRIPQTPLTMPLTQHTLPFFDCKSYIDWPHWDYRRVPGTGHVKLNDIVVFNYPSGDTVALDMQNADYYSLCYGFGEQLYAQMNGSVPRLDSLSRQVQRDWYAQFYTLGREYILANRGKYGDVVSRPTDRRENYVKRCVGLPGMTLQIKNRIVFLNGKPNKEPDEVQYDYFVKLKDHLPDDVVRDLNISMEDLATMNETGELPLTKDSYNKLRKRTDLVESIQLDRTADPSGLYPLNMYTGWTRDNYGPIWIPARGKTLKLTMDNIAIYERPIRVYEGNDLQVHGGKIFINGKEVHSYTFKLDYYWMMGDNRHNSADSRYWGFVPEDHIVGKPIFIWLSLDKDRGWFDGKIRWNRLFRMVDNIK